MKKNSGEENQLLQVDPITGEYYITIPEWMVNEVSWYEDTEISVTIEGSEIILKEKTED
jgi:hypothetical protein